jgi:hypothetical protein
VNDINGKIYKSSVSGVISDSIDKSNIVSFIYDDGTALGVNRENKYLTGYAVKTAFDENDNSQKWELIKNSDGTYSLRNLYSGVYLQTPDNAWRCRTTYQNDVTNISWDLKKNDNGVIVPYDHKKPTRPISNRIVSTDARGVANTKDIAYTDVEKEFSAIMNRMKAGDTSKTYTINCSYTDAKEIESRIHNEFFVNSEGTNFVTNNSLKNGELIINLSVGTKLYRQTEAVKKAYIEAEKKCGVTNKMSDREKVRQINRYICNNYDSVIGGSNMYQMMVRKYGSCVQHSMLFNHLCNKYGVTVQNVSLTSIKPGAGHMLNRVKIGNTWYFCDINLNNGLGSDHRKVDETFLFIKDLRSNPRNGYSGYDLKNIKYRNEVY